MLITVKTKNDKPRPSKKTENAPYPSTETAEPMMLREAAPAFLVAEQPMVRTQIYLSKREHEFVLGEAGRRGQPMAAIIREYIDANMEIPDSAWSDNPLLGPSADPGFAGPEDGVLNLDHYVYGGPKKWMKRKGKWIEAPPPPEDYHANPARAAAFDQFVEGKE